MRSSRIRLSVLAALALSLANHNARAAGDSIAAFEIPAQPLIETVREIADLGKLNVLFEPSLVSGKQAPALSVRATVEEALATVLRGSGLTFKRIDERTITIVPAESARMPSAGFDAAGSSGIEIEEIVVTGTHIRGAAPVGSELLTIGRDQIEASGLATTPQLIQSLPQNSGLGANEANFSRSSVQNANFNIAGGTGANLRGLGPLSTLVLVNGRRIAPSGLGTFADIGAIPLSAVERVEVVPDGASALYGSDAVGGVINFVLRRDFAGIESSLRYGAADGFDQVQGTQLIGQSWRSGSALLSYEYEERERLMAHQRDYFTQDLRRFGGSDFRTSFANPGNILAGFTSYAIPQGQDGRDLDPSDLIPGVSNLQDQNIGTTILPERRQHSVVASLHQEVTRRLSLFFEGYYTHREVEQSIAAQVATLSIPDTNPYFVSPAPGASSVMMQYSFLDDLGPTQYENTVENYNFSLASELLLAGDWQLRAHISAGADDQTTRLGNVVNQARLALALADPNPVTAFNPFGDGSHTAPATLDAIRGYNHGDAQYSVTSASAVANGSLFTIPGGRVRLAVGAEYREEELDRSSTSYQSSLTPVTSGSSYTRAVEAAYAELLVPIVGDANRITGVYDLQLSLAGRYERYDDFGSSSNPKVGLTWSLTPDLTLRASWGTSFQSPTLVQLTSESAAYGVAPLPDPQSPSGQTLVLVHSAPGNPNLKPQEATTWSVGLRFNPSRLPGLSASLSYFSIDYEGLIGSIGLDAANALFLEHVYGPLIVRNPSAEFIQAIYDSGLLVTPPVDPALIGAFVDMAPANLGVLEQQGIDVLLGYDFDTSVGRFGLQATVTRLLQFDVSASPTAPSRDRLDTVNNPVDLRFRAGATWRRGAFGASVFLNYVDSYDNDALPTVQKVDSWTTMDLQVSYEFANAFKLALQGQNLFDSDPPFLNSSNFGYDPTLASPVGRFISLQLRKKW